MEFSICTEQARADSAATSAQPSTGAAAHTATANVATVAPATPQATVTAAASNAAPRDPAPQAPGGSHGLAALFARLPRLIQERAQHLGKDMAVHCDADGVLLGPAGVDALSAALVPWLRHRCDAGIEDPATRRAMGKPARASLWVTAREQGHEVWVEICDDGSAPGLLNPPTAGLDIHTNAAVADRVALPVLAQGGRLDLDAPSGGGTLLRIHLPAQPQAELAVGLRHGAHTFWVPQSEHLETLHCSPQNLRRARLAGPGRGAPWCVQVGDEAVPLVDVADLLDAGRVVGTAPSTAADEATAPAAQTLLIAGQPGARVALRSDHLLGTRSRALHPLHAHYAAVPGILGATLGDDQRPKWLLHIAPLAQRAAHIGARAGD